MTTLEQIGKDTMDRLLSIRAKIEYIGRTMGVPPDEAVKMLECSYLDRTLELARRIDEREAQKAAAKSKFDALKFIHNAARQIAGDLEKYIK